MARKKNPEVHVDINSHNFADNPRAVMDALGKASQRPHRTKSGTVTSKPSPRLKARRAKNTRKGYFPNPDESARMKMKGEAYVILAIAEVTRAKSPDKKQAWITFSQGAIGALRAAGVFTAAEHSEILKVLKHHAH